MFLCDNCHPKDCPRAFIEEMPFGRSRGPCEKCHQEAECVDCQGYKARQREEDGGLQGDPGGETGATEAAL